MRQERCPRSTSAHTGWSSSAPEHSSGALLLGTLAHSERRHARTLALTLATCVVRREQTPSAHAAESEAAELQGGWGAELGRWCMLEIGFGARAFLPRRAAGPSCGHRRLRGRNTPWAPGRRPRERVCLRRGVRTWVHCEQRRSALRGALGRPHMDANGESACRRVAIRRARAGECKPL